MPERLLGTAISRIAARCRATIGLPRSVVCGEVAAVGPVVHCMQVIRHPISVRLSRDGVADAQECP
jgi:hypothetical protein